MKFVKVDPAKVTILQEEWRANFTRLLPDLEKLQVVSHGQTSKALAHQWLECVCKVHPLPVARTCISQAGGLGSRDIRSLMAFNNGEHYPALSPNEIYQSKQLKAFPLEFSIARNDEPFIVNAIREILTEQTGVIRKIKNEQAMLEGSDSLWLKSRPSMYGKMNNSEVIIDIHINRGESITRSDEMRLHYHNLVASSIDFSPDSLFQANLYIEPEFKKQLVKMASISESSEVAAAEILKEAMRTDSQDVVLSTRMVQQNKDLYSELIDIGQSHWNKIIVGEEINFHPDQQKAVLSSEAADELTELSKRLVVANSVKDRAEQEEQSIRQNLTEFAMINGISKNYALPYEGVSLREYTTVNHQSLFDTLTNNHNIKPEQLQQKVIDQSLLFEITDAAGLDVSAAVSYPGLDKDSIQTMANNLGLELSDYSEKSVRPYFSGQKRGPVFDALKNIRTEIGQHTEFNITELTHSDMLDDPRLTQGLKGAGVSQEMIF